MSSYKGAGAPLGVLKEKIGFGDGMRRIEADYYAARALEKRAPPKEERSVILKMAARKKSDLSAEVVANIRWLREHRGLRLKVIASIYGISEGRAQSLCNYTTWGEIDPSREGIDLEKIHTHLPGFVLD